jgi:hypothetical protein
MRLAFAFAVTLITSCDLPPGLEPADPDPVPTLGRVGGEPLYQAPADGGADAEQTAGAAAIALPAR